MLTARKTGELHVGRGELGAAIDDHDDGVGLFERDLRLPEDLAGDKGFVVGHDATGIDQTRLAALPLDLAVDAVAGDAGLVADDGAAGAGEAVEERALAHVGAAADGEQRQRLLHLVAKGDRLLQGEQLGLAPVVLFVRARGGDAATRAAGAFALALLRRLLLRRGAEVAADALFRIVAGDGALGFELGRAPWDALGGGHLGLLGGDDFALAGIDCAGGGCGLGGLALVRAGARLPMLLA